MNVPVVPGIISKQLRHFDSTQLAAARAELHRLALFAKDARVRLEAARYITQTEDPGRRIELADSLRGLTVAEAADTIVAATAAGQCSLEDGERLMNLLKTKAEFTELATLRAKLDELLGHSNPRRLDHDQIVEAISDKVVQLKKEARGEA